MFPPPQMQRTKAIFMDAHISLSPNDMTTTDSPRAVSQQNSTPRRSNKSPPDSLSEMTSTGSKGLRLMEKMSQLCDAVENSTKEIKELKEKQLKTDEILGKLFKKAISIQEAEDLFNEHKRGRGEIPHTPGTIMATPAINKKTYQRKFAIPSLNGCGRRKFFVCIHEDCFCSLHLWGGKHI